MFCTPVIVFSCTEGVGSRFHFFARRVSFSCFALLDSFLTLPKASVPVFMFCTLGLVFGGTVGVWFLFHVLRSWTHFRRYRGRPIPFSCFARPDLFLVVLRASGPVFKFCTPRLVFGVTEGVGFRFHVLRTHPHFLRYRGRRVPFSCFASPHTFSSVPRASGLVFVFCAPALIFGGTEGIRSRFHVVARLDSFSSVLRASGPVYMFCALGLIFDGTDGVGSRFHVLIAQTHFRRYRGLPVSFSCFARPDSFSAVQRASSPFFMFLRTRTHFWLYHGNQIPFSCFARSDSFSAVTRAAGPVFMFYVPALVFCSTEGVGFRFLMFCAPRLVFDCAEGVGSRFSFFCQPGLVFDGIEGVGSRFLVLRARTRFRPYQGRRVPFSYFVLPDLFLAVPRESDPFFMFCASGLVFSRTEGVRSLLHVLRSRTRFRRYRGRRLPFSSFASPDSFLAVSRESDPVFMYCAPGLVFGRTEGVRSHFHVLRSRTHFLRYRGRRVPFSYFARPDSFSAVPRASVPVFIFLGARTQFRPY
jgi:hypothetical protein